MAKTSYGPRALRAWRKANAKRTAKAVGAAIGRTGQTIANYEAGACPCEHDRLLLSIVMGNDGVLPEGAWRTEHEIAVALTERTEAAQRAMTARGMLGG